MARKPQKKSPTVMATVTNSRIIKYNVSGGRCRCGVEIDNGKEYVHIIRNVDDTPQKKAEALARAESNVLKGVHNNEDEESIRDIHHNLNNWDSLAEPRRQRVGQRAIRDLVTYAREAKALRRRGSVNNPEAVCKVMRTRRIINNVWDVQTGTHAARATYFNLSGPGDNTEYGDVNAFVNHLQANANTHFTALIAWLDDYPEPQEITTE